MNIYTIGALLKIIVGVLIMTVLYNYVNVYADPAIGISFGFLAVFMIVRGASYYLFLGMYRLFSQKVNHVQISQSYKLSLLLGVYIMMNLTLIITNNWSKLIALAVLIFFIIAQTLFINDRSTLQKSSVS